MTYRIAGMESFQQSGLKISAQRSPNAVHHSKGVLMYFLRVRGGCWRTGERERAITREIVPLSSSFMSTAVAGEYASAGGIDTRE